MKTHKDQLQNRLACVSVALQTSRGKIDDAAADCGMACSTHTGARAKLHKKLDKLLNKLELQNVTKVL